MIEECLGIFMKKYEEDPDLILNSYVPETGDYYFININTGEITDHMHVRKSTQREKKTLNYPDTYVPEGRISREFIKRDALSMYLNSAKGVVTKGPVHSGNYLTFFMKKDTLAEKKPFDIKCGSYYDVLEDWDKTYKKKSKTAYEMYKKLKSEDEPGRTEKILKIKEWVMKNHTEFQSFVGYNPSGKDSKYFKLFFIESEDELNPESDIYESRMKVLQDESLKYIYPRVFNQDKHNKKYDSVIFGLPDNNLNGNTEKKPYLLNKSLRNDLPYIVSEDDIKKHYYFFRYLHAMASAKKEHVYIGYISEHNKRIPYMHGYTDKEFMESPLNRTFTGYYFNVNKGMKEAEILDFNIIDRMSSDDEVYKIKNHLMISENSKILQELYYPGLITSRGTVFNIMDKGLFSSRLYTGLKGDLKGMDPDLKAAVLSVRDSLREWLFTGKDFPENSLMKKISYNLLLRFLKNGYYPSFVNGYNIRKSLFLNNNDNNKEITMWQELKNKVVDGNVSDIETSEEFSFAVGQLWKYLISLSEASGKSYSLILPVIQTDKVKRVKSLTTAMIERYSHAISVTSPRVNALISLVMCYDGSEKTDKEMILAGLASDSVVYFKEKKDDNDKKASVPAAADETLDTNIENNNESVEGNV